MPGFRSSTMSTMPRIAAVVVVLLLTACGSWTKPTAWAEALEFEARTALDAGQIQDRLNELHEAAGYEPTSERDQKTYQQLMRWQDDHGQTLDAQLECMIAKIEAANENLVVAGDQCHQEYRARFK